MIVSVMDIMNIFRLYAKIKYIYECTTGLVEIQLNFNLKPYYNDVQRMARANPYYGKYLAKR